MAENTSAGNGQAPISAGEQAQQPQLNLQKVYVRDASFEVPNAPQVFQEQGQPQIQLNLAQKAANVAEGVHEVVLTLTVTCTLNDRTAYLAEVHQAGIFGATGFDAQNLAAVLGTYCPNVLFPYARQVLSDMVLNGGFPPFLLQPINFDALYAEQQKQQAQAGSEPAANA
ncbi:MAG TPA: protein-export chaperone SecB [Rhodanobacteraceae bacterium]|nr:protein-export chaperone SecB [Rhodanobacteraceae bacterium]